jgi:hypothetical protein
MVCVHEQERAIARAGPVHRDVSYFAHAITSRFVAIGTQRCHHQQSAPVRCPFHTRVRTNAITHMQSQKLVIHTIILT